MNKIICPNCGEIRHYCQIERVHRYLIFDKNDESCGATEDITEYSGKVPRCMNCMSKVRIIQTDEKQD